MPRRAPRPCNDCGAPTHTSRCPPCEARYQQRIDQRRPSASARGYDARWQRTRRRYLREHPTCVVCGQPATDVDHIDGLGPHGPRGHDPTNLRSLCHPCHSRRTARDQPGGWARND